MPELQVETLDHLGLVAGVIDELGLVELTNELLPPHEQNCISSGQVLKAMLLNCFGFLSAPLYLFSHFFESKPVAHLLGPGIEASHLNDDRIGRLLDSLTQSGTTVFFLKAAMQGVITISGVQRRRQKKAYPSGQAKVPEKVIHHDSR